MNWLIRWVARWRCTHLWDRGRMVDRGRNTVYRCIKCGKARRL